MREARKEALPYRKHAVEVLGVVAESFKVNKFDTVFEMLSPLFRVSEDDEMEEEEEGQHLLKLELHEAAISALGKAFPADDDQTVQGRQSYLCLQFFYYEYLKGNIGRRLLNCFI